MHLSRSSTHSFAPIPPQSAEVYFIFLSGDKMTNKESDLLTALQAIERDCVRNHAGLLATDPQFQLITSIARMLIQTLEKNNH